MTDVLKWSLSRRGLAVLAAAAVIMASVAAYAWRPAHRSLGELVAPPAGAAAVDYFLKIDGIPGESTDAKHPGEINLDSFSWGQPDPGLVQSGAGSGEGGGAGKVTTHDIHFTMKASKASPKLMGAAATGKHIPAVLLTVRKAGKGQQDFFKIMLTDAQVSSYKVGGPGSQGSLPEDEITLKFAKIQMQDFPQKADGTLDAPVEGTFDVAGNTVE